MESLTRPYRVTLSMVVLVLLVPFYVFIPELMPGRTLHVPELAWDRMVPLQPAWALVYGALYLFLILLPVLVVRQEKQIRRTVLAYLMVWIAAYVCFLAYPTQAPRPPEVPGEGFAVWGLRFLYSADPPYNCRGRLLLGGVPELPNRYRVIRQARHDRKTGKHSSALRSRQVLLGVG